MLPKGTVVAIFALALLGYSILPARADPLPKPVIGPKLICFKYSVFRLAAGERITDAAGSPEGIAITLHGPNGEIGIGESEIFAPAKGGKRLVFSAGRTKVYRVARGRRYAIYGPTYFSEGADRLVLWLSGPGLSGGRRDRDFYSRFDVRNPEGSACEHVFTYSWDAFVPS